MQFMKKISFILAEKHITKAKKQLASCAPSPLPPSASPVSLPLHLLQTPSMEENTEQFGSMARIIVLPPWWKVMLAPGLTTPHATQMQPLSVPTAMYTVSG